MEVLRVTGVMGVLIFLFLAAWMDARTTRIPNGLLLSGILFVLFFVGMMEQNSGLPETVVGCAATGEAHPAYVYFVRQRLLGLVGVSGLLLCLTLFRPGAFGGGDVKLTALTGFLLGWRLSWYAVAVSIFSAGVYVLWKLLRKEVDRSSQIPFGPFLCLGTAGVLVFPYLYFIWNCVL